MNRALTRIAILAALALLFTACADDEQAQPANGNGDDEDREEVVLSAVTSFSRDDPLHVGFFRFVENLESEAPWVTIDYRGGPDAIDSFEQGEAIMQGAVDMGNLPESYYPHLLPFADALKLTPYTPMEEREQGIWEFINEVHEDEMGVHYLGRGAPNTSFQLYLNMEVATLDDFRGATIRVSPIYAALIEELGGAIVSMGGGDIYGALERGVIEGFGWTNIGFTVWGWEEVTEYELLPEFYSNLMPILVNLDTWKGLDEETRAAMTRVMEDTEAELMDEYEEIVADERAERAEAGMQTIELEGEEAERFLEMADRAGWDYALAEAGDQEELVRELQSRFQD